MALIVAGVAISLTAEEDQPLLPVQFRLEQPHLSGLPVRIDLVRSCACWVGPRGQSQRKYKFRVVNDTDRVIDIGGGVRSVVRLIVAYPRGFRPRLTTPASGTAHAMSRFASPPDIDVGVTYEIESIEPNRIRAANDFFAVPRGWTVWALPATPNKLAEGLDPIGGITQGSFPTVVDRPRLLPGEAYEGAERGHGTWTFYIPLPPGFPDLRTPEGELIPSRDAWERHLIFVGIAAMRVGRGERVELLGFAPAPSDAAMLTPDAL